MSEETSLSLSASSNQPLIKLLLVVALLFSFWREKEETEEAVAQLFSMPGRETSESFNSLWFYERESERASGRGHGDENLKLFLGDFVN